MIFKNEVSSISFYFFFFLMSFVLGLSFLEPEQVYGLCQLKDLGSDSCVYR